MGAAIDKWITDNVVLKLQHPEAEKIFQPKENGIDIGALRAQMDALRRRKKAHLQELRNDPDSDHAEYREARKDFDDQRGMNTPS